MNASSSIISFTVEPLIFYLPNNTEVGISYRKDILRKEENLSNNRVLKSLRVKTTNQNGCIILSIFKTQLRLAGKYGFIDITLSSN
ncbi:MAG: hypothetical protein K0Q49_1643 [Haloplasmataceae bacterium]|jgi:hypothetical protein|nr:hypothetical protein [Haloplasmataceae bacterium]